MGRGQQCDQGRMGIRERRLGGMENGVEVGSCGLAGRGVPRRGGPVEMGLGERERGVAHHRRSGSMGSDTFGRARQRRFDTGRKSVVRSWTRDGHGQLECDKNPTRNGRSS